MMYSQGRDCAANDMKHVNIVYSSINDFLVLMKLCGGRYLKCYQLFIDQRFGKQFTWHAFFNLISFFIVVYFITSVSSINSINHFVLPCWNVLYQ